MEMLISSATEWLGLLAWKHVIETSCNDIVSYYYSYEVVGYECNCFCE